jgi:hypothetical protein
VDIAIQIIARIVIRGHFSCVCRETVKKNTCRQTKRGTGGGPRVVCSSKLMGDSRHLEHGGEERREEGRGEGVL